tara:strand:- start:4098 stop:5141 length:1044 start_codon:yes stop_codon:yes gene_type:complete
MEIKNDIINLINNPDKKISFKSCIIIYGNSGIGKTYKIKEICNELNLKIINFNISNASSSIEFEDLLFKTITTNSFEDVFNNNIKKKKIIILDNYETFLSIDRTINNTLYNILNTKKYNNISIICICNLELLKRLGNIKKKCKIIQYKNESNEEIIDILKNKYKGISSQKIKEIVNDTGGNIEQSIYYIENNIEKKENNAIDKIYNIEYLYDNEYDKEVVYKILSSESWLIPLRYHENLIIELKNRKTTLQNKNNYYKEFLLDFCLFDLLMNKNIIESALNIITYQVYNLKLLPQKKQNKSNLDNFTKLLSYLSLQKKYIKKGYIFTSQFYQIGNYHINSININLYT